MKMLKICRTLCIISVIICLLIRWMPISYNTIPKVCIAAFLAVALFVNGKYSSNNKWHPSILSKYWGAKGFLIGQIVLTIIFLITAVSLIILDASVGATSPLEYLIWLFLVLYQVFNAIILYRNWKYKEGKAISHP